MPRARSPQSESDSEPVSSKKQKKREESPADDPMDEDGGEEVEEEVEYEIEVILDSSERIFEDGEMAYFVKWRGYPNSENSWVRESDAPNADELISKYLDSKRGKEKAAKKAAAKPRKSTEVPKSEPKKRGRVSTKSKAESDEEEPERSPVQPIAKKQKKASASTKKFELNHDDESLDMGEFSSMEKHMDLDSWDGLIEKIDTIERDEEGHLFIYGTLTTKENFRLPSTTANSKFPQKIIKFYEDNLRWKTVDETA